ncbi:MAG TPA: hypothetical protein VF762_22935 [Blastocatellia bacterium]|jgi:hypothetical protein
MRDSEQAIVRRVLLSLLDTLGGPPRVEPETLGGASANQAAADEQSRPRVSDGNGGTIIIIVPGRASAALDAIHDFGAHLDGARGGPGEHYAQGGQPSYERPFTFDPRGIQTVHPGLEKFPLAEIIDPLPAPKTCFMEPGRVCVNSGACEMRGY